MAGVSDVQVCFKMQTVTDVLDGSDDPEDDDHLYVVAVVDGGVEVGDDEVGVVGQPAHQEDGHHSHHHLHHLGFIITTNITIITITIIIVSRKRDSVPIIIFDTFNMIILTNWGGHHHHHNELHKHHEELQKSWNPVILLLEYVWRTWRTSEHEGHGKDGKLNLNLMT